MSRYMNHMREAVEESRRQTGGGPVTLLAHSAGGWLARVYLLSFGTEGGYCRLQALWHCIRSPKHWLNPQSPQSELSQLKYRSLPMRVVDLLC